ncbi:hypothetical protein N9K27_02120 [Flavobacteriaceae bacterium]|nr:hypothetical protein [Flavobacteriaceae bacterium]
MGVFNDSDGVELANSYGSTPLNGYVYFPANGVDHKNAGNYIRLVKDSN